MIIQRIFAALSNRALSWTSSHCCGLLQAASCFDGVWWCRCSVKIFYFRQTSYRQMRSQTYQSFCAIVHFFFLKPNSKQVKKNNKKTKTQTTKKDCRCWPNRTKAETPNKANPYRAIGPCPDFNLPNLKKGKVSL